MTGVRPRSPAVSRWQRWPSGPRLLASRRQRCPKGVFSKQIARYSGLIRRRRQSNRIIHDSVAITPGTRIGVNDVAALIGAEGMGPRRRSER